MKPMNLKLNIQFVVGLCLLLTTFSNKLSAQCAPDMTAPVIDISGVVMVGPYDCATFQAGIPVGPDLPFLDACDNVAGTVSPVDNISGIDTCTGGIIMRTWTVQDTAGNIGAFSQMITILGDTLGPVWDQLPGALDASFACTAPGLVPSPTAMDDCNNVLSVNVLSDVMMAGTCTNNFTRTITYQAEDVCGNTSEDYVVTLTIQDTIAPTADALPDLGPFACIDDIPAPDTTVVMNAMDNCGGSLTIMHEGDSSDPGCSGGIVVRTYSVTDVCGNALQLNQNIAVSADDVAPTADALPDLGPFACYTTIPAANVNDVMNEMDNCGGLVVVTHVGDGADPGCAGGIVIRTYRLTDVCTNTRDIIQNIVVSADNTPPTADALPDLGPFDCATNIPAPDSSMVMNVMDNCGGVVTVSFQSDSASPGCAGGNVTRTYRIEDACGNGANLTQNITISPDTENPTVSNVADGSITTGTAACPAGTPSISLDADVEVGSEEMFTVNGISFTGPAVGTNYGDNCTADSDLILRVDNINFNGSGTDLGACIRWVEISYTVQDLCNNFNEIIQRIRIQDEEDPTISLAPNALDRTCACEDVACLTAAQALAPSASDIADNCPSPILGNKNAGAFVAGATCPQEGSYTNTWEIMDACGNAISYTQVITIEDNMAPTIDDTGMSFNITLNCDDTIPAASRLAAMDNCDGTITQTDLSVDDNASVDPCGGGTILRTWSVADACGTVSQVQQMITINPDTIAPIWNGISPLNLTANCNTNIDTLVAANIPTGMDNCNLPLISVATDSTVAGTCAGNFVRTLTYTISDNCGNTNADLFSVVITVSDTDAPIWDGASPLNLTANCTGDINALVAGNIPTAMDNCSMVSVSLANDSTITGTCAGNYVRTLSYSVTDDCGNINATSFEVILTVSDTAPPIWNGTSPLNLTASCTDDLNALVVANIPTAMDSCSMVSVSLANDSIVAGTCAGNYVRTLSYVAADSCGNVNAATFEVVLTVSDNAAPIWDSISPVQVSATCEDDIAALIAANVPTAMDSCSMVTVSLENDTTVAGNCAGNYVRTLSYETSDDCGNTNPTLFAVEITVSDTTAPMWTGTTPLNLTTDCDVDLDALIAANVPTGTDNCSGVIVNIESDSTEVGTCAGNFVRTINYELSDSCGNVNADLFSVVITASDNMAPIWDSISPVNLSVNCSDDIAAIVAANVPTATDDCSMVIVSVASDSIVAGTCAGNYVRTLSYNVADDCGNMNAASFEVVLTVSDTAAPNWDGTSPLNLTASCTDDIAALITANVPTAMDSCSMVTVSLANDSTLAGTCAGNYVRTLSYTVADDCGNSSLDTFAVVLTVSDNAAPIWDSITPLQISATCEDDILALIAANVPTAMDSCSMVTVSLDNDTTVAGNCAGNYVRTLSYETSDDCGNTNPTLFAVEITVSDTITPTWNGTSPVNLSVDCSVDIDSLVTANVPTGMDNCSGTVVSIESDSTEVGTCAGNFLRTINYELSDSCGNINADLFSVMIMTSDNTAPIWDSISPINITADCSDDITALIATNVPTATDDCSMVLVSVESDSTVAGTCAGNYVRTLTYSVADECGNANSTSFDLILTVSDNMAPTWDSISPLNLTASCTDDIDALIAANIPTATDSCSMVTVSLNNDTTVMGTCAVEFTRTLTYEVADDCGNINANLFEVVISVADTQPMVTCQDIIVDLDSLGMATITAADLVLSTMDACGTVDSLFLDQTIFTCSNLGANTVTLTAIDNCGNLGTCTATVTVNASAFCTTEISLSDPCGCKNNETTLENGQLDEPITVTAPPGQNWTVAAVTGLFASNSANPPAAPAPIAIGTVLPETPVGSGQYILTGVHVDALGFSIEVTNGAQTLDTMNVCFYPNPVIEDLAGPYCLGTPAITLVGNADPIPGTGSFTIDGTPAIVFDAADLGIGNYEVEYTFDADSVDVNNPGCIQAVDQFVEVVATPSTVTCEDPFNVSLDDNCMAVIRPDIVLKGLIACYDNYVVELTYPAGTNTYNPANQVDASHIGQIITYGVTNTISGVTCEGTFSVFDLRAPVLVCENDTVNCQASLLPADLGFPTVTDNCSNNISLTYNDITTINGTCDQDFLQQIVRQWIAVDEWDNRDTCQEIITIVRDTLTDIVFPDNRDDIEAAALSCDTPNADPSITGRPTLNGQTLISGDLCGFDIVMEDDTVTTNLCEGTSIIFRKWTVFDCTGNNTEDTQIIKILDKVSPTIVCPADITISTGADACTAEVVLLPATVSDNCSSQANINVTIVPAAGNLIGNVLQNIPFGTTDILYIAEDDCGNKDTCTMQVEVIDLTPPKVVCDLFTTVSLISEPTNVPAGVFDSGSSDNCSMTEILVRRMDEAQCPGDESTSFGTTVPFYCCDAGDTVRVEMQVTDQAGNVNSCMVQVVVQDKLNPSISCPANITLSCEQAIDDLTLTGNVETDLTAVDSLFGWVDLNPSSTAENWNYQFIGMDGFAVDNCSATISYTDSGTLDNCGEGTISRIWTATDPGGRTASCVQQIRVVNIDPFDETNIVWAPSYTTNMCGANVEPSDLPAPFNAPVITPNACADIFTTHQDLVFNQVDQACMKILRTWIVIDWCQYDQNNPTAGGRWEKVQVIKVMNAVAPTFVSTCINQEFCTTDPATCSNGFATLVAAATDDCTPANELTYRYKIDAGNDGSFDIVGNGNDASGNYPIGTHAITFTVEDGCGNEVDCSYIFTIKDCINPVAKCKVGETISLPTNGVVLPASHFDAGSFDNCTNSADLNILIQHPSLGPNQMVPPSTAADSVSFDCLDFVANGELQIVDLWVQDEAGNWDYCIGAITLQALCFDPPSMAMIAGYVENESGDMVDEVNINLDGYDAFPILTGNQGDYAFDELPTGDDYGIIPEKNINMWNGVTSSDLVVLGKHLLNIELIDSPYRRIAA
ncbi:MAG: HYR domain-containing protein, partial [Saprospiraceae bacterium]